MSRNMLTVITIIIFSWNTFYDSYVPCNYLMPVIAVDCFERISLRIGKNWYFHTYGLILEVPSGGPHPLTLPCKGKQIGNVYETESF